MLELGVGAFAVSSSPAPSAVFSGRAGRRCAGAVGACASPLGSSTAALMRDDVRVPVLGRTSTEDQQDPRQSILRQVGNCKTAMPDSWVVVAYFYDVESGRMELDQRGRGENYERFDIPIARDCPEGRNATVYAWPRSVQSRTPRP